MFEKTISKVSSINKKPVAIENDFLMGTACRLLSLFFLILFSTLAKGQGLSASITGQSACGATGSATVNATGGTSPYTYVWSNAATTQSISGLANGNYIVTVTDAVNTKVSQTITINSIAAINAGSIATICHGQSTHLSAAGASAYSWTPSTGLSNTSIANPIASPTITTTYTVSNTSSYNLITNGDFSLGNTGFTSSYGVMAPSSNSNCRTIMLSVPIHRTII